MDVVLIAAIKEKINRGLGMSINAKGGLTALRNKIGAPEAAGGLTDTMADRATIVQSLKQLLDHLETATIANEIAIIYVHFVSGDPTRFSYAQVFAFKTKAGSKEITASGKMLLLGEVVKNLLGGGYRWKTTSGKVLTRINDKRAMEDALTKAASAELKSKAFADLPADKAAMIADFNRG